MYHDMTYVYMHIHCATPAHAPWSYKPHIHLERTHSTSLLYLIILTQSQFHSSPVYLVPPD